MTTTLNLRVNKYAAACYECGGNVPAEGGLLDKQGGRWVVWHADKAECDALRARAVVSPPPAEQVTEPGMYRRGDSIFKVQKARGSGNLYAKALTPIGGRRLTESDEVVGWEFTYAPGAVRNLTPADRMTLDEAKQFGIRYGVCCVCGAHLKDAESVAAGIGPVCGGRV